MEAEQPEILAAVDLGSNSFHMIVSRLHETGTLTVIDKLRESIRLGGGLDESGKIDEQTRTRALACLERFGERIRDLPRGAVRVVGTNTLRVAKNSKSFVREAEKLLGHRIEIISGDEEARIIFLGVAHGRAAREGKRLVVDIGGGSTEVIVGTGADSEVRESLHIGCVSASKSYFSDGKITAKRMRRAELEALLAIYPHAHEFRNKDWLEAVGCSGTIKAIRNISQKEGWCDSGLTLDALYSLRQSLVEQGHVEQLKLKGLKEDRAAILPGGLAVLIAVFEALDIDMMRVSDQALREGLMYDLVGRIKREDVRDATVDTTLQRWGVDQLHAENVAKTAGRLFKQVAKTWELDEEHGDMLHWAALLHEVGLQVSHSSYHKHGAYVVENADLPGFSRPEQKLLSNLVLSHRKKFRQEHFSELAESLQEQGRHLCVLLRLAVLLHRGRPAELVSGIKLKVKENRVRITFPDAWLDDHPLTNVDLEKEREYLSHADLHLEY